MLLKMQWQSLRGKRKLCHCIFSYIAALAALSSSTLADNSDPFRDIEDEGQLETNELVIDNDGDQQD